MLKPLIKAPMVAILGISGLQVGITMTSVKFAGEIIADGSFSDSPILVIAFFCIAGLDTLFLIFSVNLSMKYYDQIDVMPTYFAQILIWSVLCGLVLLEEHEYYSKTELTAIIISAIVSFFGIQLLAKKSNYKAAKNQTIGNEVRP